MEYYIIFLPGVIYLCLGIALLIKYRKRREFVSKWFKNSKLLTAYYYFWEEKSSTSTNSGSKNDNKPDIINLLNLAAGYSFFSYWSAYIITILVTTIISFMTFSHFIFGNYFHLSGNLFNVINTSLTNPVYFAAIGAYLWGLYDFLMRYQNHNWSVAQQHFIWLKIPISMIICHFAFVEDKELNYIIAFGIGAFPLDTLKKYTMNATAPKLGFSSKSLVNSPKWDSIRGITENIVEKLNDYGIENVHQLSSADPFKLHFNSNIELISLLDFMDQAILINYIGEDRAKILYENGITGAIDFAVLGFRNNVKTIDSIAEVLGYDDKEPDHKKAIFTNIIDNVKEDSRLQLIWELWNLSNKDNDGNQVESGKNE